MFPIFDRPVANKTPSIFAGPASCPLFQTDTERDKSVSDVSLAGIVPLHCPQNRYFKLHRSKEIVSDCIVLLCATMEGMRETANSLKTKLKSEEATTGNEWIEQLFAPYGGNHRVLCRRLEVFALFIVTS